MVFHYTAKTATGTLSSGFVDAISIVEARRQLQQQRVFPLSITAGTAGRAAAHPQRWALTRQSVTPSDILMVTCQLSVMTRTGIDIAEALQGIATHCQKPELKKTLESLHADVSDGQCLSTAMRKHVKVFGETYVSTIAAAEVAGTMSATLSRLADLLRNRIRLRGSVASALCYPAALMGIAFIVLLVLIFFVLPQFATIFRDLGTTPPMMTQMLLAVADNLRGNLLLVGIAAGIGIFAIWSWTRHPSFHQTLNHWELNGPVLRRAFRPLLVGQSFRLLATLLQSNVPLIEALELCQRSSRNLLYRDLFAEMRNMVELGQNLSTTLITRPFIPDSAAQMVQTAERSGELGSILETVGIFYEEEGERELRRVVTFIEPIIVVVMGGVVAFVVAAVMLPLLDVTGVQ